MPMKQAIDPVYTVPVGSMCIVGVILYNQAAGSRVVGGGGGRKGM